MMIPLKNRGDALCAAFSLHIYACLSLCVCEHLYPLILVKVAVERGLDAELSDNVTSTCYKKKCKFNMKSLDWINLAIPMGFLRLGLSLVT